MQLLTLATLYQHIFNIFSCFFPLSYNHKHGQSRYSETAIGGERHHSQRLRRPWVQGDAASGLGLYLVRIWHNSKCVQIPVPLVSRFLAKVVLFCFQPGQTGSGRLQEKLRWAWGHGGKGEEWNQALKSCHCNTMEKKLMDSLLML